MKTLLAAFLLTTASLAQTAATPKPTVPPPGSAKTILLWPNGAPGAKGSTDADIPKLYVYPAANNPTHTAVIVLPGGGYTSLVTEKEGSVAAKWLNEHGVTAFVATYRLGPTYAFPAPMQDGSRAVRYVRAQAAQFGVDPAKIGLWGFSAGGHLAGYMDSIHDYGNPNAPDPIDRVADRPDFVILSYARLTMDPNIPRAGNMDGLLGLHPTQAQIDAISPVLHVSKDNSPAFLYSTTADQTVNSRNATAFYDVLQQTGIPVEMHIFEQGVHGTGIGHNLKAAPTLEIWPTLLAHWMQVHGWMAE